MAHFTRPEGILAMVVSLLLLAVASHAIAVPHGDIKHHTVPAQFEGKNATEYDLTKRYTVDHSKWTYYSTGKGACGGTNKDSDWVRDRPEMTGIALNVIPSYLVTIDCRTGPTKVQ